MNTANENLSLEDISRLGEKFYLDELKNKLESESLGQYVVIDVENKDYHVDADRLVAINKAQEKFGNKLSYIAQVGMLKQSTMNYVSNSKKHAWLF